QYARSDIDEELIYQSVADQRTVEAGTGFDMELVDAASRQRLHHRYQIDPARTVGKRERFDVGGPSVIARARSDNERRTTAEHPRLRRGIGVAIHDDTQRLAG